MTTYELRCPSCKGTDIAALHRANIAQPIGLDTHGQLEYGWLDTDSVEFLEKEWYVCQGCGEHAEVIDGFKTPVITYPHLPVGTRVRLKHAVERFPHFVAPAGMTGTVTVAEGDVLCITVDDATGVPGLESWDGEIQWFSGLDPSKDLDLATVPSDNELRALARAKWCGFDSPSVEIDRDAQVSRGDDPGAFVSAWLWVPFAEAD